MEKDTKKEQEKKLGTQPPKEKELEVNQPPETKTEQEPEKLKLRNPASVYVNTEVFIYAKSKGDAEIALKRALKKGDKIINISSRGFAFVGKVEMLMGEWKE